MSEDQWDILVKTFKCK